MFCIHPGSCRYCFFSTDPKLFDGYCTVRLSDEAFEAWVEKCEDKDHAGSLREFREWEKKRAEYYGNGTRARY